MKQIDISTKKFQDTFALIDDSDYKWLNKDKWHASEDGRGRIYAVRNIRVGNKFKLLKMHVAIMGHVAGKEVDHRNRITLDNQRHNLRHCTNKENQWNSRMQSNNTSGYKGVCWHKNAKKWHVQITYNKKLIHLGYFTCLINAAKCYDEAAKKYYGKFANLNF